jgi:ribonucleotide monophosphatase NagD (HAD superfamily)
LVEKLAGLGIASREEAIPTPPVTADRWLAEHATGPAALLVPEATRGEFGSVPRLPDDAEPGAASVVIGNLGEGWSFRVYNRAFRRLMGEPLPILVALGMARYWRAADALRLDVVPTVVGLRHVTAVEPAALGKPVPPFFEVALSILGWSPEQTIMTGDDVAGGGAARQPRRREPGSSASPTSRARSIPTPCSTRSRCSRRDGGSTAR